MSDNERHPVAESGELAPAEAKTLAAAMVQVQRKIRGARKDSRNPGYGGKYASLSAVLDAAMPALSEAGVWLFVRPETINGMRDLRLRVTLTHAASGEAMEFSFDAPILAMRGKSSIDMQAIGAAITYARRYAIMTALNIPTEDDDGESIKAPETASDDMRIHAEPDARKSDGAGGAQRQQANGGSSDGGARPKAFANSGQWIRERQDQRAAEEAYFNGQMRDDSHEESQEKDQVQF